MAARDWAGAIRACSHYRQERHTINQQGQARTQVVTAVELSHNAAGRAFTLAQLYQRLGHPLTLLGCHHFPPMVPLQAVSSLLALGCKVMLRSLWVWASGPPRESARG